MRKSTVSRSVTPDGIPITLYNNTIDGDGFYISYNNYDTDVYGSDTTALVTIRGGQHFYILNGDHTQTYIPLIEKGMKYCLRYFWNNAHRINKRSETSDGFVLLQDGDEIKDGDEILIGTWEQVPPSLVGAHKVWNMSPICRCRPDMDVT